MKGLVQGQSQPGPAAPHSASQETDPHQCEAPGMGAAAPALQAAPSAQVTAPGAGRQVRVHLRGVGLLLVYRHPHGTRVLAERQDGS